MSAQAPATLTLPAFTLNESNVGDAIFVTIPRGVRNPAPIVIDGVIASVRRGPAKSMKIVTEDGATHYVPQTARVTVPATSTNEAKAAASRDAARKRSDSQQRVRAMQNLVRTPHRIPARNPLAVGSITDGAAGELNEAIDDHFLGHDITIPGRTGSIRGRYQGHKHLSGMVEITVDGVKYMLDRDAEFTLTVVPRVPQNPWAP